MKTLIIASIAAASFAAAALPASAATHHWVARHHRPMTANEASVNPATTQSPDIIQRNAQPQPSGEQPALVPGSEATF